MRRLALAVVLACTLSAVAHAGEIHPTGAVASPSPSPIPSAVTTTGDVPTNGATAPQDSSTVVEIILTLISIVR
jgi:hypothetical protein